MNLSQIILTVLSAYGISGKRFEGFVNGALATLSIPADKQAAVAEWLEQNAHVSTDKAAAMAMLILAELKSGSPGFDPQHGGGA